jgi:4-hydroxy-tetrahydrodipicolinate synthase
MSVKAMLRAQGLPVGQCRLPLPPTGAAEEEQARRVWEGLQLRRAASC